MRIGEIAEHAGVPTKTIRFWEDQGLLPEPERTRAGYRDYDGAVVERLAFIRRAQRAGFRLGEIRQVLQIGDTGHPPCEHVRDLIAEHIAAVDARIAELTAARQDLAQLAQRAAAQDREDCRGYCQILS